MQKLSLYFSLSLSLWSILLDETHYNYIFFFRRFLVRSGRKNSAFNIMFSSTAGLWIATRCRRNITIPDFMRPYEILRHSNFPGHGCRSPSLHVIGVVAIGYTASIALMREAYPRKML